MPILPAEPELFPPDLFEPGALSVPPSSDESGEVEDDAEDQDEFTLPRWWCLHVKPRQEKAAARHLHDHKLAHYLPQIARESRTPAGRKIRSIIPLFPGYLFFRGNHHDRLEAFRGGQLVGTLDVRDQERLEQDLRQVYQMLSSGLPVVPEAEFPVGSRVRIVNGPLRRLVGTVDKRGNRDKFVVVVHILGKGAAVDLEAWQIEPYLEAEAEEDERE